MESKGTIDIKENPSKLSPSKKLQICLAVNISILAIVITLVTVFASGSAYWNIGPNDHFIVISVKIDSIAKYVILLFLIALINMSRVIVEELGMPVLGFSIYNPDKKIITEFTKNELQFYANSMFFVSGLRGIFMTMVSISQIDLAVWSLIVSEAASLLTIRVLLNEKKFESPQSHEYTEMSLV